VCLSWVPVPWFPLPQVGIPWRSPRRQKCPSRTSPSRGEGCHHQDVHQQLVFLASTCTSGLNRSTSSRAAVKRYLCQEKGRARLLTQLVPDGLVGRNQSSRTISCVEDGLWHRGPASRFILLLRYVTVTETPRSTLFSCRWDGSSFALPSCSLPRLGRPSSAAPPLLLPFTTFIVRPAHSVG
jgi:hypothetical protein